MKFLSFVFATTLTLFSGSFDGQQAFAAGGAGINSGLGSGLNSASTLASFDSGLNSASNMGSESNVENNLVHPPASAIGPAITSVSGSRSASAPAEPWQQRVTYDMDVRLDVETHRMDGTQTLVYYNNSPDTLRKFYYHLYFNAFQPNSMMDVRSRTINDPDGRVRDRIYHLDEDEIGYQRVLSLQQDNQDVTFRVSETVLIVDLNEPIAPGESTTMDMVFESQVPVQIRRSGRYNREGIAYSMAQWYPRIAGYDQEGWATSPYIGREFHGTFGDFDVRITIDSTFTIGGTGYLQNPQEIGKGYEEPGSVVNRPNSSELTWYFHAPDVIDFMWGADDQFTHRIYQVPNGPRVHLLYVESPATRNWERLGDITVRAFEFLNEYIGEYPYEQFSIIQGGDGGMEYPMATLITGHRNLRSLVGVTVHELLHMWFQSVLATNESRYHWMDEGMTVYMSNITMQYLFGDPGMPHFGTYMGYLSVVNEGLEEPMNQHADRFETNRAYSMASYRKGAIIMHQLAYIIGEENLKKTIQEYYRQWQFKHPNPTDFRRVAEQQSGLILDWYFDDWLNTTKTIDYGIDRVRHNDGNLEIHLSRNGESIMPLDILVQYDDGSAELLYVPQQLMLGEKPMEPEYYGALTRVELDPWRWVDAKYTVELERAGRSVERVIIDPTYRLADVNRLNNTWPKPRQYTYAQPVRGSWDTYHISYRPAFWYGQESGIMGGLAFQGEYLFGQNRLDGSLMLTSGNLEDPSFDMDYFVQYERALKYFGRSAYAMGSVRRYYGIGEEAIAFRKHLGRLGEREQTQRVIGFRLFHQRMWNERNIPAIQNDWGDESTVGMQLVYTVGDMGISGIEYDITTASSGGQFAASFGTVTATHTKYWGINFRTRYTLSAGIGSQWMPSQYRWALSGPTGDQIWRNYAHSGIANINAGLTEDLNLLANDGTGLIGYGLSGIGSPDMAGNNYFTGTIWNTWRPMAAHRTLRNLEIELFAATGKSWVGDWIGDFPEFGETNPILASMGTGVTFDLGALPIFNRYRPQSRFLQDLQVSVRMPFYMNGLVNENDFGARFVIGVSERF